jgi:hypothetical protein
MRGIDVFYQLRYLLNTRNAYIQDGGVYTIAHFTLLELWVSKEKEFFWKRRS